MNITRNFVELLKKRFSEKLPLIQIVMGPRQVGKTTGVMQFQEQTNINCHYISADSMPLSNANWILEQWQTALTKGDNPLLIIDEIQKADNWSEVIKNLWDKQLKTGKRVNVLLLGSSSLSLKKGVSESLAGRYELIPVVHWDFIESKKLREMELETYLNFGGYPKSYDYLDDYDRWFSYVKSSIIDNVIDKDILNFALIKNPSLFKQAFEVLSCYPAQEISYRKLLGQLQDRGNTELIKYYIKLFEGAYLIKAIQKYGTQDFKIKSSSPKIIPLAPCFYTLYAATKGKEGFVFEATVGAKLLEVSHDLYYWRQGNSEVDYILSWKKKLFAIEVKSGRKRSRNGLNIFLKLYPNALPIIISKDNYENFISDPKSFLELVT
jgi:predicted AAA+ superfamily ATPase